MFNPRPTLLCLLLISGCATHLTGSETGDDEGYFADATDCQQTSMRKQQVKVPTGTAMTVIDVPLGLDAGAFSNCMVHAGHQPPKVDPKQYLEMSSRCLTEARAAADPDQAYGNCVRSGGLSIEPIIAPNAQ